MQLKISQDVIDDCLTRGQSGLDMLETSTQTTESMSRAAGPNGPLRGVLQDVEDDWRLRRERLIEAFGAVLDLIRAIDKAFVETDQALAASLECGPAPQAPSGSSTPGGGGASGGSGGGNIPPLSDGGGATGGTSGDGPTLPPLDGGGAGETTLPSPKEPDVDPLGTDDPALPEPPICPPAPTPPLPPRSLLSALLTFAQRWSALTGRPATEVLALLVAGMGASGLITGEVLKELGGGEQRPASGDDGDSGLGEITLDELFGELLEEDQELRQLFPGDLSIEELLSEAPPAEEILPDDTPVEDLAGSPEVLDEALPGETPLADDLSVSQVEHGKAFLSGEPEAASAADSLPDLPPLEPLPEGGGGGGGGSSAAPLDLPPLTEMGDAAAERSGIALPPLGFDTDSAEQPMSMEPLPDLEAELESPGTGSSSDTTRRGGFPMMGMGGMGGGSAAQSSGDGSGGAGWDAQRTSAARDANQVLADAEQQEEGSL